jgi:hypothetical protein
MSDTALKVIEMSAYLVTMGVLVTLVWIFPRYFTEIECFLKENFVALKRQIAELSANINLLRTQQLSRGSGDVNSNPFPESINRLNEISQRLEQLHQLPTIKAEKDRLADVNSQLNTEIEHLRAGCQRWGNKANELRREDEILKTKLADTEKIKQELDHITLERNTLEADYKKTENERDELKSANEDNLGKLNEFRGRTERYEEYLPVGIVDRVCREVTNKIDKREVNSSSLHYIYSRLAVLLAINNLKIEAVEKGVMLRDAFFDFDKAVFAQFMGDKNTLQLLRDLFEKELTAILDGSIKFRWPKVGAALELDQHRQETENGMAIIKEVKTAILYSGSGSLIQKSVVIT